MDPTDADRRALALAPFPPEVLALLAAHDARPRLVAHLTLVHDVARRLVASVQHAWPALAVDPEAVAFGAATHDLGEALHPRELVAPGTAHESDGEALLRRAGFDAARARFARTHGTPFNTLDELPLDDLLAITADTVWKGRRALPLDDALVAAIQRGCGVAAWKAFAGLDTILAASSVAPSASVCSMCAARSSRRSTPSTS